MDESDERSPTSGYWFPREEEETASAVELLDELRRYRQSNAAMRSRVQADMGMGEKDLLALRLLLAASAEGRTVRQRDLAEALGITAASSSALVDRLERGGFALRTPHPADRRSTAVTPTARADHEVRGALRSMHTRMIAVAEALSPSERAVVTGFLRTLNHSLEDVSGDDDPAR